MVRVRSEGAPENSANGNIAAETVHRGDVRIRIIRPPTETMIDGISLSHFEVGVVYSVPSSLATLMIVERWAEPVIENLEPKLPAITLDYSGPRERRRRVYSDWRLRVELGIAADRRRRR